MGRMLPASCLLLLIIGKLSAQTPCTSAGQNPTTAFSICGKGSFFQPQLSSCYNRAFFVTGCTNSNTGYGDRNPVYYQFTCRASGSFAFTVTPVNQADNYDWQLFDITGRNPNDIYTDKTLGITGNYSGTLGTTGASATGVNYIQCRSFSYEGVKPTFSAMPQLLAGHTYLLVISGSDYAGKFNLTVDGGTADISSNPLQEMKASNVFCGGQEVLLSFGRKIKCSSIAADGSDFIITPAASTFTARGKDCSANDETDTIHISFTNPLPDGRYKITLKNGTDGNTIVDRCNTAATTGIQTNFSIYPYAVIDTILQSGCTPDKLLIQLSKNILCYSIAANGSDFIVNGPSSVTIASASLICTNGQAKMVELKLNSPITTGGNYAVLIKNGTDANTLIDNCLVTTPAGVFYDFTVTPQVNADFTYTIREGCIADTLLFNHPGGNGINSWQWAFAGGGSTLPQPTVLYSTGGNQTVSLTVSNGSCSNTKQQNFTLKDKLKVEFTTPPIVCNDEAVVFTNKTINATNWLWDFGNGTTSNLQNPAPKLYPASNIDKNYLISLTAQNANCTNTVTQTILVKSNCTVFVPSAFTPNGDGLNDLFGPMNSNAASDLSFFVFNRYGQTVFSYSPATEFWNGNSKGVIQPVGIYTWVLSYKERVSGKNVSRKGVVMLMR
jgi:gliding motility-associated-like protein